MKTTTDFDFICTIPNPSVMLLQPESGGYMVYAAPYPMEAVGEMPGYYVPVYDQAGNATLVPATTGARDHQQTTTILQAAPPHGTAVYQAAPNTTLIPALPAGSQLVYASDGQFAAAGLQQPQQFTAVPAASYHPGTTVTYAPYAGTAYNAAPSTYHPNFWGQPMTTYYVSSSPGQPVAQGPATAVPIQIPVQMPPPQPMNTQSGKGPTHSSPSTPQATTFGGNPFNPSGTMTMGNGDRAGDSMAQPVYAMQHQPQPVHQNQKYQNVYPYTTPVVSMTQVVATTSGTPPTAIYQTAAAPYQPPVKATTTNASPSGTGVAGSTHGDAQTNSSSTTSTPLQKSPPTQIPDTSQGGSASNSGAGQLNSYDKKLRRGGPPTEMGGNSQSQHTGPPRTHGYLGNNYNAAYARNPNQPYTPRAYAPKKHYPGDNGGHGVMGPNKSIVLNAPMNQSTGSPGIYGHYHPSAGAAANVSQGPPHQTNQPGIRGPRPKPANLDLRRTGSHYQGSQGTSVGAGTGPANGNGNSQRNTPSTNSTESNNSPNGVTGGAGGGGAGTGNAMVDHGRGSAGGQMGYYPAPNSAGVHHPSGHPLVMHQPLMGSPANAVGHGGHPGMYVKLGQTYFPHVSD